jgi:small subunit ribosomal protein S5
MASRPGRSRVRAAPQPGGQAPFTDERTIEDTVVKLYRCATVVKGGRRFSFGALVIVGDRQGQVGYGYGKANEVPLAVEKGVKQARRAMFQVPLRGTTIPHRVIGHFGASRIVMLPAAPGTGVIAGAAPRAVLELAGVKDVLTKCYGSTSPKNLVKATISGLRALRTRTMVEEFRGVRLDLPPEREPVKPAIGEPVEPVELTSIAVADERDAIMPEEPPAEEAAPRAFSTDLEETPHDD